MLLLTPTQSASLAAAFALDLPGPQVGAHVLQTGHGQVWADRWPAPRALLAEAAGNYTLAGDAGALQIADLPALAGFLDAPAPFLPLVRAAFPDRVEWPRVIFELPGQPAPAPLAAGAVLRPLVTADAAHLAGLGDETDWISKTWGGPAGLAASGYAWGVFVGERLASVAGTFNLGARYEDVGVATEPEFRGQGLNTACATALCRDILARGHRPSWSTSLDNPASQRVARKLGFVVQRYDVLYVVGRALP